MIERYFRIKKPSGDGFTISTHSNLIWHDCKYTLQQLSVPALKKFL